MVILVSGWRRVGKTTLLLRLREAAIGAGRSAGGFLSVARFEGGEKTGIDLMDASSGAVIPLARYTVNPPEDPGVIRIGPYVFDPAAMDAALRCAESGQDADVFFVDELGPLELEQGGGWAAAIPLIGARRSGTSFVVVRPELIGLARARLGLTPDSPLIMVDEANRDTLAATWAARLASGGKGTA